MRRVAFRFGVVFALLAMFPFPLGWLPYTRELANTFHEPVRWGVNLLALLLGIDRPYPGFTGSGDTLFGYLEVLLFAIVALVAALGWTAAAREQHYDRLARGMRILLRFWVAAILMRYGLVKIFQIQFRTPPAWVLDQRVGDKSPMGLMWTFMGHSRAYSFGAGLAECIGSVLLLWRRTATLGALLLAIVMTNVVAMNFCYDVPVKLFSLQLLAAMLAIAAPDLRRMIIAGLGRATREPEPPPRGYPRAARIVRLAFLASFAFDAVMLSRIPDLFVPPTEIDGTWDGSQQRVMIGDGVAVIRTGEERRYYGAVIDAERHTLTLTSITRRGVLRYELHDDQLSLHGAINGVAYDLVLARAKPWLLETRGFRWIQEEPFHR